MRILVLTVPSWNSKVGSNTWATLLENYPPENLASIYIRDEVPDSKVCSRYFHISENRVIKSIFRRSTKTGAEVLPGIGHSAANHDLEIHNARYVKMKKRRPYSMLLAREMIWKLGRWKTPELDAFLDDFKPDIILHSMEGYIHLNRIAMYAIRRTGTKAVGYIWDDNFTYRQHSDIGYLLYRFFQRKSLKKLAGMTTDFFAISPFTKKEADAFFGIDCQVLTKPLLRIPTVTEYTNRRPIRLLYTGNLLIGRDRSLEHLSNAVKALNRQETIFQLDVYTQTVLSESRRHSLENEFCRIHAPIPQEEVLQKQQEADILVFLEDIDGKDAKVARLSFSTKITDYLSAGKCILAIGNKDTAPMQYLIENRAAAVCCRYDEILPRLAELSAHTELLTMYAQNAAETGMKNHEPEKILEIFQHTVESAVGNKQ